MPLRSIESLATGSVPSKPAKLGLLLGEGRALEATQHPRCEAALDLLEDRQLRAIARAADVEAVQRLQPGPELAGDRLALSGGLELCRRGKILLSEGWETVQDRHCQSDPEGIRMGADDTSWHPAPAASAAG